jgi:biotin carboxyl carrier protein
MSIEIESPMPGTIQEIFVMVGDRLDADEQIIVLEAMKMEHSIFTPAEGVVTDVLVEEDQKVEARQVLVLLESPE